MPSFSESFKILEPPKNLLIVMLLISLHHSPASSWALFWLTPRDYIFSNTIWKFCLKHEVRCHVVLWRTCFLRSVKVEGRFGSRQMFCLSLSVMTPQTSESLQATKRIKGRVQTCSCNNTNVTHLHLFIKINKKVSDLLNWLIKHVALMSHFTVSHLVWSWCGGGLLFFFF